MNPIVLIATHNRTEITSKNISSLLKQTVKPQVVLVVSEKQEVSFYKHKFPEVLVCVAPNRPLGAKWQAGVDFCKNLNPDPLIINGSDDILGRTFVENACELIKTYDFVGLSRWHILHDGILYEYDYNTSMPLGGGRCYSNKLLNDIRFQLFDTRKDKHLDDFGWANVNSGSRPRMIIRETAKEGMDIVSIKGNWDMLNPFDKFHGSRNVTLISKSRDVGDIKKLIDI